MGIPIRWVRCPHHQPFNIPHLPPFPTAWVDLTLPAGSRHQATTAAPGAGGIVMSFMTISRHMPSLHIDDCQFRTVIERPSTAGSRAGSCSSLQVRRRRTGVAGIHPRSGVCPVWKHMILWHSLPDRESQNKAPGQTVSPAHKSSAGSARHYAPISSTTCPCWKPPGASATGSAPSATCPSRRSAPS